MKKIISAIIVFGLINLLLYGGQKLFQIKDIKQMNIIESTLTVSSQKIEDFETMLETQLSDLDQSENTIQQLGNDLDRLYDRYPNGAPADVVAKYNSMKDEYNSLILQNTIDRLNYFKLNTDLDLKVSEHNKLVDEYNMLSAKTSKVFLLIPIPRLRK